MIIRINTGTSFKGAALYYLHDKKREGETERLTTGRVAWTHALNTLEEDPEHVIREMQYTAMHQQVLKHLSGNRTDGRPTDVTVMTVALAWSPEQKVGREEMIEAGQSFLKHMGWQEHQVLFVSHNDTKHPHVHLIINRVHPETGMTLDGNWSKTRAQPWALAYEKEHGRVWCEAREAKYGRDQARSVAHMNYREWRALQEIGKHNAFDPDYRRALEAGEWSVLKGAQRQEREAFWKETGQMRKELRAELRDQVREEFAEEWQGYAQLKAERGEEARAYDKQIRRSLREARSQGRGAGHIAKIKERQDDYHASLREELWDIRSDISSRQKARLEELAGPALEQLSEDRTKAYDQVLARHREEKATLREDQSAGTRRHDLLAKYDAAIQDQIPAAERSPPQDEAAKEATQPGRADHTARDVASTAHGRAVEADREDTAAREPHAKAPRRDAADLVAGTGLALIGKVAESVETIFDTPPAKETNREDEKAMAKKETPVHQPQNEQAKQDNIADAEKRRKEDLDFYLKQRDRERYRDYDRGR